MYVCMYVCMHARMHVCLYVSANPSTVPVPLRKRTRMFRLSSLEDTR